MNKVIVNCQTGEQEVIPLSGKELEDFLENEKNVIAEEKAKADELEQKAAEKIALLNKLGITEDEAKLLLS